MRKRSAKICYFLSFALGGGEGNFSQPDRPKILKIISHDAFEGVEVYSSLR